MVALTAAHGERYVVKKMVKAAPQYQPYSVKSHGKKTQPPALYTIFLTMEHVGISPVCVLTKVASKVRFSSLKTIFT